MPVTTCRICEGNKLELIFSLGSQPLANNLPSTSSEVPLYPLELLQCMHCSLIQLSFVVPKEKLFDTYFYIPSLAKTYMAHFERVSQGLIGKLALAKNDFVVDIGGSDGSLLKCFQDSGMKVLNVEPAKNIESKVKKFTKYFTPDTARTIVKMERKAKLVTATNVFAHIDNLHEFIEALDILLDDDGVFFAQFPDARNLLAENQFDTIYHEHLSYFTYEPLYHLFTNSPLELYHIESSKIHGGSMRIYVRRRKKLLKEFKKNTTDILRELSEYLEFEKANGKKIAAFGAAAKGMVLLYAANLNYLIVDYVLDNTPYKIGKFTPGTNIPIVPESRLLKDPPDILLILAWNYKEEIIAKVRKVAPKTTFVIPIPKLEII